jgi:MarR family transcriptional regulator, transcriptional regulator for hemolysin
MSDARPTLGFVLHEVSRTMRKRMDQRAAELGLTRAQWWVMTHLARQEGCKQAELAESLEIEPITLARHIDRLTAQGLVERRACAGDRRAWRIHFTTPGRELLLRLQGIGAEIREEAMAGMAGPERDRLIETLLFIKSNLSGALSGAEEKSDG